MSAQVIPLRPAPTELEQAWAEYEQAVQRYRDLAAEGSGSTLKQRCDAAMEANRRHRHFYNLCARAEAGR